MTSEELQYYLDINNIGNAPIPIKIGVVVFIIVGILAAGIWFDTRSQLDSLERFQKQEAELKTDFQLKVQQASKLDLYKEQLAEMEASFDALLRQLPAKTDVESLLIDISQTALASGLEIQRFKPSEEIKRDFYAELPISLRVTGSYHELATFISGVAGLPRIVTLHELKLEPSKNAENNSSDNKLDMIAIAKTYRYLQDDETSDDGGQP